MTEPITVELQDPDGILDGDGRNEGGLTRFDLLRRAAVTGGAVIGGGLLISGVPRAFARGSKALDVQILNFLNLNESLEVEFYGQAVRSGALKGRPLEFARQLEKNEIVHRDTVRAALGSQALPLPAFNFKGTTANQTAFLASSLAFENNDVAANNGAGPLLSSRKLLAAAGQIVSVEGRQAAWIRRIVYGPDYDRPSQYPAPNAFDAGITLAEARRRVAATGFVQGPV